MILATAWFQPPPALVTAWFGPDHRIEQMLERGVAPDAIPVVIGPVGPAGPDSAPQRIDQASPAATWILAHSKARIPMVQVFIASGEEVIADVTSTTTQITVTHASPQAGFVLAF